MIEIKQLEISVLFYLVFFDMFFKMLAFTFTDTQSTYV